METWRAVAGRNVPITVLVPVPAEGGPKRICWSLPSRLACSRGCTRARRTGGAPRSEHARGRPSVPRWRMWQCGARKGACSRALARARGGEAGRQRGRRGAGPGLLAGQAGAAHYWALSALDGCPLGAVRVPRQCAGPCVYLTGGAWGSRRAIAQLCCTV